MLHVGRIGPRLDDVPDIATIELLYFPDCPHWELAADRLREVTERRGLDVSYRVIDTDAEATRIGFLGSPTILIDGRDVFATGDEPVGLSCRLYATPNGMEGAPTIEQLSAVLG